MVKLTLPCGLKPKVQLPDHDSIKLTNRRIGCWTGAGRAGNFLFDWERMLWELVFVNWEVGWSGVRE